MIFTPAYAQDAAAGPGAFDLLFPMVLVFVIMYFLIIRPQQRKAREHREMLEALRRGDEVVTAGGVIGKVSKVKEGEDEVEVEIAENVKIRVVKGLISAVTSKTEPASKK